MNQKNSASMNKQQNILRICSELINQAPLTYFKDTLKPTSYQDVVFSQQPVVFDLPDPLTRQRFMHVVLDTFKQTFGFYFNDAQNAAVYQGIQLRYSHWKTDDWKWFFCRCTFGDFGRLEGFNKQNPQALLAWMQQYEIERKPYQYLRSQIAVKEA